MYLASLRDARMVPGMPAEFAVKNASVDKLHHVGERHAAVREVAIHASVAGHRNVPELYAHCRWMRRVLVASELMRGGDVDDALSQCGGALPWPVIRDVGVQVASALTHMHAKCVGHCDIKPANVMFRDPMDAAGGNTVKVVDFGLATRFTRCGGRVTAVRVHGGTYEYMAPEALADEPHDPTLSDVYSVGAMLFQLATGLLPFPVQQKDVDDWEAHLLKRKHARVSWPPWARGTPAFKALVIRMLAGDPGDRPALDEVVGVLHADCPFDTG